MTQTCNDETPRPSVSNAYSILSSFRSLSFIPSHTQRLETLKGLVQIDPVELVAPTNQLPKHMGSPCYMRTWETQRRFVERYRASRRRRFANKISKEILLNPTLRKHNFSSIYSIPVCTLEDSKTVTSCVIRKPRKRSVFGEYLRMAQREAFNPGTH
jgi:hypothetical protein